VLMTKFDKARKIVQSGLRFRIVRFGQFQNKVKRGYNPMRFEAQVCFRHGNGGEST
jgi:hypothetical protein